MSREACSDEEQSGVSGQRILRLLFLRAPPSSIEEDSRQTIQELLFRFLRMLIPHSCRSCGRVEQVRDALIMVPLKVSPAPASALGRDNRVAGGELCFVLGLALLLLAFCVPYRCHSLQYRWSLRACALRRWQSGLRFAGANGHAIPIFGKPGGRMNLRSNGRSKRMRS